MPESSERTIKEWMDSFQGLYESVDRRRTPEQIWIATMAHGSTIGESIRRFHFSNLATSCAHTFCWICSFVNRCNTAGDYLIIQLEGSLSDWVSTKYPQCCGLCRGSPCRCKAREMDEKEDKVATYKELREKKKNLHANWDAFTVSEWQKTFDVIYGERIHLQSLESIGFHLLEEVGECAKAIRSLSQLRISGKLEGVGEDFLQELTTVDNLLELYLKYESEIGMPRQGDDDFRKFFTSEDIEVIKSRIVHAKMDMVAEMGDTFSWFCSILNRASQIASSMPAEWFPLDKHLESIYASDGKFICPTCEAEECNCVFLMPD